MKKTRNLILRKLKRLRKPAYFRLSTLADDPVVVKGSFVAFDDDFVAIKSETGEFVTSLAGIDAVFFKKLRVKDDLVPESMYR
ncbi:MAG: hypothetical protein M1286_00155 [Candidatus Marsarchaeota archaeon]|nr:hypothetical protein [Candidatus Marsarchaeota archaeon]